MIRVVEGLQKYNLPPLGVFVCFCSHYESDNSPYFILCLEPGGGYFTLLMTQRSKFLKEFKESVVLLTAPYCKREASSSLRAEHPALSATSGAHVPATPHPCHILPLHDIRMLLSLSQPLGAALDPSVLGSIEFYFLCYPCNVYTFNFFRQGHQIINSLREKLSATFPELLLCLINAF